MVAEDDEQSWIRHAQAGDPSAYRLLVEQHQNALARLVGRLLGPDYAGLDEVIQDVFVKAYFALDRFRGQSAFRTWLMHIAVNRCRDEQRRLRRRWTLTHTLTQHATLRQDGMPEPSREALEDAPDALAQQVQAAVASLPEKLRVVITLKDLEGYSYEDVSRILQCKLGTVKSRHARGREQLRQRLAAIVPGLQK